MIDLVQPWLQTAYRARDRMVVVATGRGADPALDATFTVPLGQFLRTLNISHAEIAAVLGDDPVPEPDLAALGDFHRIAAGALPDDLTGQRVLDVGGYDGHFSRLCIERGAARVRLIDNGEWQNYHWRVPPTPEGVQRIGCDVLEWQEAADLVVCGNVIYHMRDPWRALRHLRTLCRGRLVLWTSFVPGNDAVWKVVDPDEEGPTHGQIFDDYYTVFWRPSVPGLLLLLRRTGWTEVEEVGRDGDHVVVTATGGMPC